MLEEHLHKEDKVYTGLINTAAVGAIESQRVPQGDGITHISAGYRIFDNVTRSHWGSDLNNGILCIR